MSGEPAGTTLNIPQADARVRLQKLAYSILSPSLGRRGRTLIAHVAVDRAFVSSEVSPVAAYPVLRERVVRRTLATGRRRAVLAGRPRASVTAEPDLTFLLPAARAAYALRHVEGLNRTETHAVLAAVGVGDPATATTLADRILIDTRR
ncbi:hypothetical protein [Sporichthya sp.]|uniref:hypothetical protein n=1 Tax=Sporichthya sp. TaxID=65475 RepID=UPI001853BBBD|nr:hypothetical protein [Sporichthya sp.]MBA3742624.1 hypothetical protein [Sporichthya sp.]